MYFCSPFALSSERLYYCLRSTYLVDYLSFSKEDVLYLQTGAITSGEIILERILINENNQHFSFGVITLLYNRFNGMQFVGKYCGKHQRE